LNNIFIFITKEAQIPADSQGFCGVSKEFPCALPAHSLPHFQSEI